jgi:hypothetical protein
MKLAPVGALMIKFSTLEGHATGTRIVRETVGSPAMTSTM